MDAENPTMYKKKPRDGEMLSAETKGKAKPGHYCGCREVLADGSLDMAVS